MLSDPTLVKPADVTTPLNLADPSEDLISATTEGVVVELVPLSNVHP